jgi:hypothetical protein
MKQEDTMDPTIAATADFLDKKKSNFDRILKREMKAFAKKIGWGVKKTKQSNMKQYDTIEDLLNEYNKPETQKRLIELRDQELGVLETKPVQENIIRFSAKQEEVIRLAKGKFYYRGEEVEDKYQVYERFNKWLTLAENTATISKDK